MDGIQKRTLKDFFQGDFDNIYHLASEFNDFCNQLVDDKHFYYKRIALNGSGPVREVVDRYTGATRSMLYMASNDYLNLSNHPAVIQAGVDALQKYGAGAGSVPLLGGLTYLHEELAKSVAAFKGCEDAILYTSGFGANFGSLAALLGPNDLAICDMLSHASIVDGCERSNKSFFVHNNMDSLEKVLSRAKGKYRSIIIAVDGVYSMDGDIAPLDKIHELAKAYNAYIYVDEAHSTGIIGKNGKGTPSHFDLDGQIDFVAGTFSKGLGGVGGFVASSSKVVSMLHFFSRHYMFSTAMTPQVVGSMLKSLEVIQHDHERRARLWRNIKYFKEGLNSLGFELKNCETAIFPIVLKDDLLVKEATRLLHELNVYVNPVLYPAVAKNSSRIRISLMSEFTLEQLAEVLNKLEYVGKKLEII